MPDPREEEKQEKARIESERSHLEQAGDEDQEVVPDLPEKDHAATRERGGRYGDGWW